MFPILLYMLQCPQIVPKCILEGSLLYAGFVCLRRGCTFPVVFYVRERENNATRDRVLSRELLQEQLSCIV